MENARVITLSPSTTFEAVTFEEAFGEHSEASGRRQAKKAERQAARQQRKIQRQENRAAKKVAKVNVHAAKKAAKQAARQERRLAKQEAKSGRQEVRQGRRTARVENRIARRNIRRPDEEPSQEDETSIAMQDTPTVNDNYSQPETGGEGEGTAESDANDFEPKYSQDLNEDLGGDEVESQEDADEQMDESEDEDNFSGADGADIEGNVADIQNRIKANALLIDKIKANLNRLRQSMNQRLTEAQRNKIIQDMNGFKAALDKRLNRAIELDAQLEAFSSASGRPRNRKKRHHFGANSSNRGLHRGVRKHKPNLTTVESGLHADIQKNRIVVPAAETNSSADGIEVYATDATNEFDAPQNRVIELKSGFDGLGSVNIGGKKVSGANLLVGAALIGLGIYAAKKYKLFG